MARRRIWKKGKKRKDNKKRGRTLKVTYPNGRTEVVPDDGRHFPEGTMVVWNAPGAHGKPEMRWCVTGGGWPFDD